MNSFVNERDRYQLNLFPKVASTTLKTWFWYDLEGRHDEFISDPPPFPADRDGKRVRIHRLVNPLAVKKPQVGEEYQVFTVVRNPFSRLVSAYWSVVRNPVAGERHKKKHGLTELPGNFEEFVDLLSRDKLGRNAHWAPMSKLRGPVGDILRVESLTDDFVRMCEKLGKKTGSLPRYHSGKHRSKAGPVHISEDLAEVIRQLYAADFERFGYDTEVPEKLTQQPA